MSNRTVEAILRLSTKLGSMKAFRDLSGNLEKVDRQAKRFNRSQSAFAAATGKTLAATARFLAPAAVAYGIKNSVTAYASAERRLNRIAVNADKGKEAVDSMLAVVNQTSHDFAISQDQVAEGLETLVAAGRSADEAMAFLPSVTATAQAAGAEIADIATTADAVGNSFDITADKMQHAFDILVTAGNQGKFELRDMARYLPSMAPAFAALGYKGEKGLSKLAAMLQTIRQRTGSAEEAATAAQNIFQKMESDQTAAKFAKFGIDLRKEMAAARRDGKDLVDVFLDLAQKATKGDLSKIPQLFTDAQFQVGMRALMQGRRDMEGFQKAFSNVDGTTMRAVGQILSDTEAKLDRMASSWDKFKTSLGKAVVSTGATDAMDYVSNSAERAAAVNAGLEKNGVHGFLARSWWGVTHGDADKDAMAWAGGYRTEEQRRSVAAYQEYSKSRNAGAASDAGGIPVPTPRPNPRSLDRTAPPPAYNTTQAVPALIPGRLYTPGASPREAEIASMASYNRQRGDIADQIATALDHSGDKLVPQIEAAGGGLGKTAADAIAMQADSIGGRIGAAVGAALAPYIKAAVNDLSRPIGSLGGRSPRVNADVGQSGLSIEGGP
jgi:TP901 family phage tail tape measure protein